MRYLTLLFLTLFSFNAFAQCAQYSAGYSYMDRHGITRNRGGYTQYRCSVRFVGLIYFSSGFNCVGGTITVYPQYGRRFRCRVRKIVNY